MKTKHSKQIRVQPVEAAIIRRPNHQIPVLSLWAALVLFLALNYQAAAQTGTGGGPFPTSAQAETTSSFGCFRIWVDPNFYFLLNANGSLQAYLGWNGTTLTSPGLSDNDTVIGESGNFSSPPLPANYPVNIGGNSSPSYGNYSSPQVVGFSPYYFPDFTWPYPASPPSPLDTILTELQSVDLKGMVYSNCTITAGVLPPPAPAQLGPFGVQAGYWNSSGTPSGLPRSLGMVQRNTTTVGSDFPARSFFDVFAVVTLPSISGTESYSIFPSGGAVLTNGTPLVVLNTNVDALPPSLGYYHDPATLAVPLIFKFDNPNPGFPMDGSGKPYWWHAGDVFGNIELAGHGTFDPCAKNALADAFVTLIMGTANHSAPAAPLGGLYPGTAFPWTNSVLAMTMGTNSYGQKLDVVTFSNVTTLAFSDLELSGLSNPVALPTPGNFVIYTNNNTTATMNWTPDMQNYYSGSATGAVQILIENTNTPIDGITTYSLQMLSLNLVGATFFGNFEITVDPKYPSLGSHIVQQEGVGYNIGNYCDVLFDVSLNGGASFANADNTVRMRLENPPCGANLQQLHVTYQPPNVIIDWADPSYTLVGSASLNPAVWVPITNTSPVTLSANNPLVKFLKLTCD